MGKILSIFKAADGAVSVTKTSTILTVILTILNYLLKLAGINLPEELVYSVATALAGGIVYGLRRAIDKLMDKLK